MIITTRFAFLLAVGAVPVAFAGDMPELIWLGLFFTFAVLAAGMLDWLRSPDVSALEIERRCDEKLSLGTENPVILRLRNRTRSHIDLTIRDEPPYQFDIHGNTAELRLAPKAEKEVTYHVVPHSRGDFLFGDVYLRLMGPMKLVIRQCRVDASKPVKVYPNLLDIRKYELMIRRGRTLETGLRRIRLYGRGTEFESLREYAPDDEFRQVDWKASARRGRLMSRQYQVERSQNVVILLDAGRTMSVRIGDIAKLDYAINASLMLAYVAASGDDKVGMLIFSKGVDRFLPPAKGRSQALSIMEALYNVPMTTDETDYAGAFFYLTRRWRKRSLIVVFSDLLDPESSRQIITHLQTLAANHLCMCVAISDSNILASARLIPNESKDLYEKAAAIELLNERQLAISALEKAGVVVVDAEPGSLSIAVVNRYLDIKTRMKL